ncbi:MAG: type II secretion system protein GspM [Pseudomonadota bacterium]
MSAWWSGLNARERVLIGVAVGLSLILVLWLAVITPTVRAKATAKADVETASATLDRLLDGYAKKRMAGELGAVSLPGQVSLSPDAFRGAVTRDAAEKGLSISRLQGDDGQSFSLVFERVQPQQLFYWLQAVETNFGGRVSRMTLEQAGEGTVRASVELEQAGS